MLQSLLQDELFREQVRSVLGDSFINNPAAGPGAASRSSGSAPARRTSEGSSASSSSDPSGMLRALAGMGTLRWIPLPTYLPTYLPIPFYIVYTDI